jgi:hypothetical protein
MSSSEITLDQIRERAYELWERNHHPQGLEIEFWLTAERELKAERARLLRDGTAEGVGPQRPDPPSSVGLPE